jgi:hypothetical protein
VQDDRLVQLRTWARALEERGTNEETRAAAKAILMLADEVDELQQKLDVATAEKPAPAATAADAAAEPETAVAEPAWESSRDEALSGSFFSRLKRTFGFQ